MSKTVVPDSVWKRAKAGPIPGLVPVIEPQPNGDNKIVLRPPAQTPLGWEETPGSVTQVPERMQTHMFSGLPTEVRRSARERYGELLDRLWRDVNLSFYKDGEVRFPKSIQDEIAVLGIAQGKPNLDKQVEALARRIVEKGARQQREQDRKAVTLDWHGHLSA